MIVGLIVKSFGTEEKVRTCTGRTPKRPRKGPRPPALLSSLQPLHFFSSFILSFCLSCSDLRSSTHPSDRIP